VIKYVCRHGYKGKPLQDLQKALWYLERYVKDLEIEEALTHIGDPEEALDVDVWRNEPESPFNGIDRSVSDWTLDDVTEDQLAMGVEFPGFVDFGDFPTEPVFDVETPEYTVQCPPDRIAGDTPVATAIKDKYYDFDRHEIIGYCAECDRELKATDLTFSDANHFDPSVKFCSTRCVTRCKAWQARTL
jgi:hypothetical protein